AGRDSRPLGQARGADPGGGPRPGRSPDPDGQPRRGRVRAPVHGPDGARGPAPRAVSGLVRAAGAGAGSLAPGRVSAEPQGVPVRLRALALPVEHGGWGVLVEPSVLGPR